VELHRAHLYESNVVVIESVQINALFTRMNRKVEFVDGFVESSSVEAKLGSTFHSNDKVQCYYDHCE
jgi:hypothetical protein